MTKRILTIHSEDRDINKWPNPSEFEVILPDSYTNVKEINLLNFTNTNNFYNISEKLLNNYLQVNGNTYIIPDGFYNPDQLAFALTQILENEAIYVLYDKVKFKFLFLSEYSFNIDFESIIHTDKICENKNQFINPQKIADQYSHWGIGYNLGFITKNIIHSSSNSVIDSDVQPLNIVNIINTSSNINNVNGLPSDIDNCHFIYSDTTIDLNINNTIYMEIDKFNNADEIVPYQYRSNYLYCNDYNSKISSYFAKILLNSENTNNISVASHTEDYITFGSFVCDNSIDRLMKLKFKFRYHNGTLVDFQNKNFNFTLQLLQECSKKKL